MSEPNNSNDTSAEIIADDQGFAPEPADTVPATATAGPGKRSKVDADVKRRNLMATFGSGPGKLALIAVAVVVVVFVILAASNMRKSQSTVNGAQVDAPTTPPNSVTINAVTPEEMARRAEQSRKEAEEAKEKGASYQPGFDYNVSKSAKQEVPPQTTQFAGYETDAEASARASNGLPPNGGARNLGTTGTGTTNPQQTAAAQAEQQRREQEMQRTTDKLAAEQKIAEDARDKYAESVSSEILKQIGGMFSTQGTDSLNNLGSYSQATYNTARNRGQDATGRAVEAFQRTSAATRKVTIKAGTRMYATLDSEANTDDGRIVLATVRNGPWKSAKLIGLIEQSNNNITLKFVTMAPSDDRPTMRVNALALREQDAKMGMAENIDHHTLSRYSSLAAAAFLQGAGRVYQQPIGTTAITNSGIVTTTEPPQGRQVMGSALGEVGSAIGAEIRRRGFNQLSTYSTPAEQGFILYFLEDVQPTVAIENQPQQQPQQQQNQQQHVVSPGPAMTAPAAFPASPGFNPNGGNIGAPPYGYRPDGYGNSQLPGDSGGDRNRGPLNAGY